MAYEAGGRLGAERASKLSHIDVVNSPLVNSLIEEFEHPVDLESLGEINLQNIPTNEKVFSHVFAVDGSIQHIDSSQGKVLRQLAFVKTALYRLDQNKLDKLDPHAPHPLSLKALLKQSAMFHATVFPLRNIRLRSHSVYDSIREIIYESLNDPKLEDDKFSIFETLKWLAYEKWDGQPKRSPSFQCPHCQKEIEGLSYDRNKGNCIRCERKVYLSDMLGFHLEMGEDSAPGSVASSYMMIHETLFLISLGVWTKGFI